MCGFISISSGRESDFTERVNKSAKLLRHRGPDSNGIFVSDKFDCFLAHTRLSILDTSPAGRQPMFDATGRYALAYNGEVYNFEHLKKYLEKKYGLICWRSSADTEVILEGFSREGIDFFRRLNGTFAFSLYDKDEKKLYLLRDPLGVKPLFYAYEDEAYFFSSELKALKPLLNNKLNLRQDSIAEILAFMYIPEPSTLYMEINKVVPGELLVISHGKIESTHKIDFFDLAPRVVPSNERDLAEKFREMFLNAVQRQLVSDVPVGIMLSGGLDSSAVAYAASLKGEKIKEAYTVSFSKNSLAKLYQSDDLHFAKLVSKSLGMNLNIIPAELEFDEIIPKLINFFEDGITDPAAINTYIICEQARRSGIKVMLTGQGADEFLAGYRRYAGEQIISGMPEALRKSIGLIHPFIGSNFKGRLNSAARRLKKLSHSASLNEESRMLSLFTWGTPKDIARIVGRDERDLAYVDDFFSFFNQSKSIEKTCLGAMSKIDQKYDLTSLNLAYCDRMSMASGVEARVPILDFELVAFMNAIPFKYKLRGTTSKYIMKKAFEGVIPNEVIYREKAGFASPIKSWIDDRGDFVKEAFDFYSNSRSELFDSNAINMLISKHDCSKEDNSNILFSLIILQNLLKNEGLV
jgi:asparagine synthase (glutamine-hydrolysing)